MFSSLISFLGGSAFRMMWGEISAFFTAKQEHVYEIERMKVQGLLEDEQHQRNMEAIKIQAELGVKVIEAQREADLDRIEYGAWASVVESTTKLTGIKFIDAWNGAIRPALATMAMFIIIGEVVSTGFALSMWVMDLVAAILGIYMADRSLMKRGK